MPRYRQRVRWVPGHLANPVWVDDPNFELGYHVRRSALPRPGSLEQLRELVARIVSRPLDRNRPLWEVYFVEGLADGRVAMLSKAHQALVDGAEVVDLAQVLLDRTPQRRQLGGDEWHPGRPVTGSSMVLEAVRDSVGTPYTALDTAIGAADAVLREAGSAGRRVGDGRERPGRPPYRAGHPDQRPALAAAPVRATKRPLAEHRRVRDAHGGTVNDVVLATITGALRSWLMTRAESLGGLEQVRALVPVSRARRGARGDVARHPDRAALRRPAGRRAEPGDPAAPGVLRVQGAQGDRPCGRGQPDRRDRRLRAVDVPRDRLAGRGRRSCAAASSSSVTNVPGPAVPALRRRRADGADLPRAAAAARATPWRSA